MTTDSDSFFRQVNIEFLVHELKDPVSVIETGARMLLDKQDPATPLTPVQARTIRRMLRNAEKTREMLNALLEVGRAQTACFNCRSFLPRDVLRHALVEMVEAGVPELSEEMNKHQGVTEKIALLASKGIRLDVTPAAETVMMMHDEIKFRQIVGNLLKNALHYRRHRLLIHLACQRDHISVAVRDDGPGIAPIHQEAIFQRYRQVAPDASVARSGHGLGLAVARILARAMGGDIGIESELGQGAVFNLHLPTHYPPARST